MSSFAALADKVGNVKFRNKTAKGHLMKQFLLEEGRVDLIKKIKPDETSSPRAAKRHRLVNGGIPIAIMPPSRKIAATFNGKLANKPELAAELFGNVSPTNNKISFQGAGHFALPNSNSL